MPGAPFLQRDGAVGGEEVRLRRRTSSCTSWWTRSSATTTPCPTACSCTTSRSSTSTCSGRCAATPRPKGKFKIYAVEGGTAAMCYIFKSLKSQPHPQPGRHDRARRADLHAVPRDGAPRGLRPPLRRGAGEAGEPVPVSRTRSSKKLLDPEGQGVLRRQPRQPVRGGAVSRDDQEDRRDPQEAAGSDPADRRRLRHVRAGLPLADGRVPEEHDRRLLLQQVLRLHRLAPGHDRASTRTTSSTR